MKYLIIFRTFLWLISPGMALYAIVKTDVQMSFLIVVCALLLLLSIHVVIQNIRLSRRNQAVRSINILHNQIHNSNQDDFNLMRNDYIEICSTIQSLFKHLRGKKCAVNIKLSTWTGEKNQLILKTFARDQFSEFKQRRKFERACKNDWELKNPDLALILTMFKKIEKSNDVEDVNKLLSEAFYLGNALHFKSSFTHPILESRFVKERDANIPKYFLKIYRIFVWDLCYRSILTVPIAPIKCVDSSYEDGLLGVISIDSYKWWMFDKKKDLDILQGIADSLYKKSKDAQKIIQKHI